MEMNVDADFSEGPISKLSDSELAEIFKRLPPYERLRASEVARRWRDVSRMEWLDVKHLDLTGVPTENIPAVLQLCPRLQTVFSHRQTVRLGDLRALSGKSNLTSIKLYGSGLVLDSTRDYLTFAAIFPDPAPLGEAELVLHDLRFLGSRPGAQLPRPAWAARLFPAYLTRLQLNFPADNPIFTWNEFCLSLPHLRNSLQALILCGPAVDVGDNVLRFWQNVRTLAELRELCLIECNSFCEEDEGFTLTNIIFERLTKLEVLFLHNTGLISRDFAFFMRHPSLRILAVTGPFESAAPNGPGGPDQLYVEAPLRNMAYHPAAKLPLHPIHIFLGKQASECIRFTRSVSNVAQVRPINAPLPQFLEREEIAPIFEGVWTAQMIKQAAESGERFFQYENDVADSISCLDDFDFSNFPDVDFDYAAAL